MQREDRTIQHYQLKATELAGRYESAEVDKLQSRLHLALEGCATILELGCGSGRDASFMYRNLPNSLLTVTDGSEQMLKMAAHLHPELSNHLKLVLLPDDLEKLEGRFEGIYSIASIMHLAPAEITNSLNLISQLLTPGGILFISVCTEREEQAVNDTRTFTLRSKKWWIDQIERANLKVTETTETSDGLNRNLTIWLNITAVKPE